MRVSVLLGLLVVAPVRAGGSSVYRIDLAWDIPVSTAAAAGILVPFALTDCDRGGTPRLGRPALNPGTG
jgi:hypothetical protein